jgi:hypothetical protein
MASYSTRGDGSHFGVALAEERGDRCFENKKGWYWYDYDRDWAIVESTVTGPFTNREEARTFGHYRYKPLGS